MAIPLYAVNDESKRITVSDIIRDQAGVPVVGALVRLFRNGVSTEKTVKTDVTGRFTLADLPYGDYYTEVLADNILTPVQKHYILNSNTQTGIPDSEGGATWDSCYIDPEMPSYLVPFATSAGWALEDPSTGLSIRSDIWYGDKLGYDGCIWHTNTITVNDFFENRLFVALSSIDFSDVIDKRNADGGSLAMPFTSVEGAFVPTPYPKIELLVERGIVNLFDFYLDADGYWYNYRYGIRMPEMAMSTYDENLGYATPGGVLLIPDGFHFDSSLGPYGEWCISDVHKLTYYDTFDIETDDPYIPGYASGTDKGIPYSVKYTYGIDGAGAIAVQTFTYGQWANEISNVYNSAVCVPGEFNVDLSWIASPNLLAIRGMLDEWMHTGGTEFGMEPIPYTSNIEANIYKYKALSSSPTISKSKKRYVLNKLVIQPRVEQLVSELGITETQAREAVTRESNLGSITSTHDTILGADIWTVNEDISKYSAGVGLTATPIEADSTFNAGEYNFWIDRGEVLTSKKIVQSDPELQKAIDSMGTPEFEAVGVSYFKNLMRYSKDQVPEMNQDTMNNLNFTLAEITAVGEELSHYTPFIGESGALSNFLAPTKPVSQPTIDFLNAVDSNSGWLAGGLAAGWATAKVTKNPYAAAIGFGVGAVLGDDAATIGGKYVALTTATEQAYHDTTNQYNANPYFGFAKGALLAELPFIGNGSRNLAVDLPSDQTHYANANGNWGWTPSFTDILTVGALGVFQYAQEGVRALIGELGVTELSVIDPPGATVIKMFGAAGKIKAQGNGFGARQGDQLDERKWYEKAHDDWTEEAYGFLWAKQTGFRMNTAKNVFQAGHLAAQFVGRADSSYVVPTTPTNSVNNPATTKTTFQVPYDMGATANQVLKHYSNASINSINKTDTNHWTMSVNYTDENGFARNKTEDVVGLELSLKDNNISTVSSLYDKGYKLVGYIPDPSDSSQSIATYAHPILADTPGRVVKVFQITGKTTNFELEAASTMTTREWKKYEKGLLTEPLRAAKDERRDAYWDRRTNDRNFESDAYAEGGVLDGYNEGWWDEVDRGRSCRKAVQDAFHDEWDAASTAYSTEWNIRYNAYQAARVALNTCCSNSNGGYYYCFPNYCAGSRSSFRAAQNHYYAMRWIDYWDHEVKEAKRLADKKVCSDTESNALDTMYSAMWDKETGTYYVAKRVSWDADTVILDAKKAVEQLCGENLDIWENETNIEWQSTILQAVIDGDRDTNG